VLTKNASLTANTENPGKIIVSLSNPKGIAYSSGSLLDIGFQVKKDAPHEETLIKFDNIAFYDEFGRPIPSSQTDGSILIKGGSSLWIFGIAAVVVVGIILLVVVQSKRKPQTEEQS